MFARASAPGARVLIDILDDVLIELFLELKCLLEPVYAGVVSCKRSPQDLNLFGVGLHGHISTLPVVLKAHLLNSESTFGCRKMIAPGFWAATAFNSVNAGTGNTEHSALE